MKKWQSKKEPYQCQFTNYLNLPVEKIAKPVEPVNGQDERRINAPPLIVPPVFANGQSRRESPKMASRPFQFLRECIYKFGVGRGTGFSYTPCLLMKPTLCLRLHATQLQPCFPAASNALALPVGNLIFAATPTERITHYTLQAKSCAKGIPFGNPEQQNRLNISHFPGA